MKNNGSYISICRIVEMLMFKMRNDRTIHNTQWDVNIEPLSFTPPKQSVEYGLEIVGPSEMVDVIEYKIHVIGHADPLRDGVYYVSEAEWKEVYRTGWFDV